MNRAERRRRQKQGLPIVKEPVLNMKVSDIQQIKTQATNTAADTAFFLMLAIPVMVIHDKYPQLMRRERLTESREQNASLTSVSICTTVSTKAMSRLMICLSAFGKKKDLVKNQMAVASAQHIIDTGKMKKSDIPGYPINIDDKWYFEGEVLKKTVAQKEDSAK